MNRKFTAALATLAVAFGAGSLGAQTYDLSVTGPGTVDYNQTFDASVVLDFTGDDMAGWSYGVCNDIAFITCNSSSLGSTAATVNAGGPPGFVQGNDFPEGYTKGIVIDLLGASTLAAGTGYEISVGNYTAGTTAGVSDIAFCITLGAPPVDVVVVVNGASITPVQTALSVEVVEPPPVPDPAFTYIAPAADAGSYPSGDGIGGTTTTVAFQIAEADQSADGLAFPSDTQGFSMACANDPGLVTPVAVGAAGALGGLNGGSGPDFFQVGLFADAWSCGVVYNLLGGVFVQFSTGGDDAIAVDYEGVAGALSGVEGTTTTPLTWSSSIGTPPVSLVVVVGGASYAAAQTDGSISYTGVSALPFERGDCNADGMVNIADIVYNLQQQFNGYTVLCSIACDADGNGVLDIADPIYLAMWNFQGGSPPPAPFGACETVAGQTPEDCTTQGCTP